MIKYLKKIYFYIIKYIYTNRLFLSYLIISLINTILLRKLTLNSAFNLYPILTDLGIILLVGAFGYLAKPKNQYKYFFTWLITFSLIGFINSIYYVFYTSFASLAELSTLSQAETVTDSIFYQLRISNFLFIIGPFVFWYIHNRLKTSSYYNLINKIEIGKKRALATFLLGIICIGISFAKATNSDYSRLSKQWNRSYIVERFGVVLYQFNDIFQTIKPKISSMFGYDEAKMMVDDYFLNIRESYNNKNKYTGILDGYNIVYVHMESMQNFLMDLTFNDEEVTPNLNKLAKEGMFFSNFYPQISTGTSSDAEYITLTGLLPSSSGTVFVSYSDNTFNTIASNLKKDDYYTFSMHGNYASMWNRSNVHPNLGYDNMFYRETFEFTDEDVVGLGINDRLFFQEAITKLEDIEKNNDNYFGTIITLSNHSPFKDSTLFTLDLNDYYVNELTNEELSSCYLCNRDVGRYIRSSHYADEALGDFINYIKESNYFNNTLFVFYGDHDAKLSYKDMNYLYNYDYLTGELKSELDESFQKYDIYDHNLNKKTPLIMWTKNSKLKKKIKGEVDFIMGMYDLAPTLYNMLNIDNDYVLGHDIFNIKDKNIVIYPNGNYLTKDVYYNNSTGEYKLLNDNVILDNNYIEDNLKYAETTLEIGNAIINYNLFKENYVRDKDS